VDGISRMGGFRFGERREQRKDPGGGHTQLSKFSGVGSSDGDVCFSAKPENRFIRPGVCARSVVDRTWDGPHAVDAGHQQARFWVSGRGGGCQRSWRGEPGGGGHLHPGAHDQSSEVPGGVGGRGRTSGGRASSTLEDRGLSTFGKRGSTAAEDSVLCGSGARKPVASPGSGSGMSKKSDAGRSSRLGAPVSVLKAEDMGPESTSAKWAATPKWRGGRWVPVSSLSMSGAMG